MNTPRTPDLDDLNPDQREALIKFRDANGRLWKDKLNAAWTNGTDDPLLRQIRNQRGPQWLAKLRR